MVDWILKLKAILHDPPDKQLIIWKERKKHVEIAEELLKCIIEESIEDENIKKADALASATSRIITAPKEKKIKEIFENEVNDFFFKNLSQIIYKDTFFQKQEVVNFDINHDEVENFFKKIDALLNKKRFNLQEERAKYAFLLIWRFLPEIFKDWIFTHPADTRAPNHSIYDHLVQTSAIVSALPKPAFLLFTIGPVQEFIATARKTQDLWSGSYLLSYLIWKAIEILIEKYGPDCVIYPNLLGQPLCDKWLLKKFKDLDLEEWQQILRQNTSFEKLSVANLPNRFLAIIPENKEIAENCEKAVKSGFKKIAEEVWEKVKEKIKPERQNGVKKRFDEHIEHSFEVYWVILPWSLTGNIYNIDVVLDEYKELVGKTEIYKTVALIKEHPFYKPVSVGTGYSLLVELNEKFLGARKSIRNFEYIEQRGRYKCSLCGVRSELSGYEKPEDNKSVEELVEEFWKPLREKHIGLLRARERLCGVCLAKRFAPKFFFTDEEFSGEDLFSFPSTAEMASISTKLRLTKIVAKEIKDRFNELNQKIESKLPSSKSISLLKSHLLYEIDGQWLMEESYRKEYLEREYGIKNEVDEKDLEKMREFLRKNKISPEKYYVVLLMDGDNMGKWLKGEKMPLIGDLIHPQVKNLLMTYSEGEERKNLQTLFCKPHPMSPSFHQTFSRRLGEFALNKVKKIVEDHYGKLIYCGGDDVLALLPTDFVLSCAKQIQSAFKETLSPFASMSAGIVIAHYKCPLKVVLDEVRDAEKKAKNEYGKNSFCVKVLTHSGEWWDTGSKWQLEDVDVLEFIRNLICKFMSDEISSRFPYQFLHITMTLLKNGKYNEKTYEILKRELKRIYERKVEDKVFLSDLLKIFKAYKDNIGEPFEKFARLLLLAKFIAKGES